MWIRNFNFSSNSKCESCVLCGTIVLAIGVLVANGKIGNAISPHAVEILWSVCVRSRQCLSPWKHQTRPILWKGCQWLSRGRARSTQWCRTSLHLTGCVCLWTRHGTAPLLPVMMPTVTHILVRHTRRTSHYRDDSSLATCETIMCNPTRYQPFVHSAIIVYTIVCIRTPLFAALGWLTTFEYVVKA